MVIDITHNPRITHLLARAEETRRLVQELEGDAAGRAALEAQVAEVYAEVGQYVHWLLRQDPESLLRLHAEGKRWAAEMESKLRFEPLPEVAAEMVDLGEFLDEEMADPSMTDIPRIEMSAVGRGIDVRDLVDMEIEDEHTDVTDGMFTPIDDMDDALPGGEPAPAAAPSPAAPVVRVKTVSAPQPVAPAAGPPGRAADAVASLPQLDDLDEAFLEEAEVEALEPVLSPDPVTDAVEIPLLGEDAYAYEVVPDDDDLFYDDEMFAAPPADVDDDDLSVGEVAIAVRTGSFEVPPVEPIVADEERTSPVSDPLEDWLVLLQDILEVLGEPAAIPADPARSAQGLRTITQVTTNLSVRWSVFPDSVQQALLGLVGARARRLEAAHPGDAELRLALGRMRRFADARNLLVVPSLRDEVPADRNWVADERRYWAVLHAGL